MRSSSSAFAWAGPKTEVSSAKAASICVSLCEEDSHSCVCDGAELRLWAEEAAFELLAKVEGGWFVVEEAEGDGGPMNTDGGLRVWRLAIISGVLLCYLRRLSAGMILRRGKGQDLHMHLQGPRCIVVCRNRARTWGISQIPVCTASPVPVTCVCLSC